MIDLDKLKELRAKATPGPWRWIRKASGSTKGIDGVIWAEEYAGSAWIEFEGSDETPGSNAALIAMAPELADEVLRLTAERDAAVAASQKLAAENARLVEALEGKIAYCHDEEWGWTSLWDVRDDLVEDVGCGVVTAIWTLIRGPMKYTAERYFEDADEYRREWFDSEEAARALGIASRLNIKDRSGSAADRDGTECAR